MAKRDLYVAPMPIGQDGQPIIKKLLVANRGEIACRVIKSCQTLGVNSVAIYTDSDRTSLHVQLADEAICLGPVDQIGGNPHLNMDLLIKTALSVSADSVHPGYGYLSENADFAEKVTAAGLTFIGPTPRAISVLGDKRTAKEILLARAPAVPLIPGYNGSEQDINTLTREAEAIGFPIMIKASAGGGGKGMRIVYDKANLAEQLELAQSEAQKSFGSSDCILERYIAKGKHIEIQIFGDKYGKVISLWERECSVQRRHQKVVEESPSPWVTPGLREDLSNVACKIGELIQYEGAGTVEFMVDVETASFYFLEVNARIQVEHPITEEVTAVDVVALQLYVAAGGKLAEPAELQTIKQEGHAIECRLCAEDPNRGFIPDLGTIWRWSPASESLPASLTTNVRFETAIRTGTEISVYFDSMIAKVVVWAATRPLAIKKMQTIMANTICIGIRSNQLFLQSCLNHPAFWAPDYSTGFIPAHLDELLRNPYLESATEFQQSLSFIPSLLLRHIDLDISSDGSYRAFKSVKRGFRNQPADLSNIHADVVSTRTVKEPHPAFLVKLPFNRNAAESSVFYTVQSLAAISEPAPVDVKAARPQKAGSQLALRFHDLHQLLHSANGPTKQVKIHRFVGRHVHEAGRGTWLLADLVMEVDGKQITAFLSTDSNYSNGDSGAAQRVFCHIAALGTFVEYRRSTLLAYSESQRAFVSVAGEEGSASTHAKAPMPCKVLKIGKQAGATVKKGDVLVVVESMKMEMNILAELDGKFECHVAVGDAVEEGKILCSVR